PRVRGRRRRRRDVVLEWLSGRTLRFRELGLWLLVLRRVAAGVGVERAFLRATRNAAVLQLRRRQARSAARYHAQREDRFCRVRRSREPVGDWDGRRPQGAWAFSDYGDRPGVGADDAGDPGHRGFQGTLLSHIAMAA